MFVNVSESIRAGLVKQMVDAGCDSTIAHETIDLAAHAIDQAIETVKNVCQRASAPQVMMGAHPLALHLLSAAATAHAEAAETAAKKAAGIMGLKTVIITDTGAS